MGRIVLLCRVEGSRVKASRYHCLVILPLPNITSQSAITGIRDEGHGKRAVGIDWFADGMVFGKSFDISERFFVCGLPFEGNILLGEIGEDSRPFRQPRDELTNVID